VLTTSSLFQTVASGPDILITATVATLDTPGYLIISDISTLQSVSSRGNSTNQKINITNQTQSTSTNSGALTVAGGIGIGGNLTANTIQIGFTNLSSSQITINTTATTRIDSYSFTSFRSTKYLIQIQSGATGQSLEVIEILLMVDNNGNVYATEYGIITNNGELGEFSADETNNTVNLYFQPYIAPAYIKFFRTTMAF
jgi:transketolase N-terminal domain/subunit